MTRQLFWRAFLSPIKKRIGVGLVLVVTVLVVTIFIVGSMPSSTAPRATTFSAALIQDGIAADISVLPTFVGAAEVHLTFSPPGGTLARIKNVTVQFELPERNIPPIPVTMLELGPNHLAGVVQFPYAGKWSMEVRALSQPNKTLRYSTTVVITEK